MSYFILKIASFEFLEMCYFSRKQELQLGDSKEYKEYIWNNNSEGHMASIGVYFPIWGF